MCTGIILYLDTCNRLYPGSVHVYVLQHGYNRSRIEITVLRSSYEVTSYGINVLCVEICCRTQFSHCLLASVCLLKVNIF